MVVSSHALHTDDMARDARASTFVTGAAGFIGTALGLEPGQWQDEAAADWVFHLPPHPQWRQARRGGLCTSRTRAATEQHPTLERGLRQVVGALHE